MRRHAIITTSDVDAASKISFWSCEWNGGGGGEREREREREREIIINIVSVEQQFNLLASLPKSVITQKEPFPAPFSANTRTL